MTDSIFARVRAVFTDLDGTLTTKGKVRASTHAAIESLGAAGIPVVIVTGRPSGWGEVVLRTWPVAAVVTENGGVTYLPRKGHPGSFRKVYGVPRATLPGVRRRMYAAAAAVAKEVRGARLASDTIFTEVNLAMDWNEEIHLPESAAKRMEVLLRARGFRAVRSSVHVNFWPGKFDKLVACRRVVREVLGGDPRELGDYVYVGDALNDEPMFAGFPRSVGVANVRAVWDELTSKPAHVTDAAEGLGFEQAARAILEGDGS